MHSHIEDIRAQRYALLVIDDEQPILDLLGEALAEDGLRVSLAKDLPAALETLDRDRFDLVLADSLAEFNTDFSLDQWTALETIKAHADTTRVVIFSAHPQRHFVCWQARGFAGFIAKPFDLDDLVETVQFYLTAVPTGVTSAEQIGINRCAQLPASASIAENRKNRRGPHHRVSVAGASR
jgi:DNA-binding NtrC family response regulator